MFAWVDAGLKRRPGHRGDGWQRGAEPCCCPRPFELGQVRQATFRDQPVCAARIQAVQPDDNHLRNTLAEPASRPDQQREQQ